jgi:hypothetical protein
MPDKITAGVYPVVQALRQAQQYFIATAIAVDIVLRVQFVKSRGGLHATKYRG